MGFVEEGKIIDELVGKINVLKEELIKILDIWNVSVKNKKDEVFGRIIVMDNDLFKVLYYVIKIGLGIYYIMGGVKININIEVLDKDGKLIIGLFVVGEVIGGLYGENCIGGNFVVEIIIFGC